MGRIKQSWLRAVQAFSILRTSFHFAPSEGAWVQVEHSVEDFKWVHEERESVGGASTEFINSLSFANEDDLARPPVYFRHVSTPDAEYVVLVMHHALYDGISLPMLFHHVRRFYRSDEPVISPMSFIRLADTIVMQEHSGTSYWSKVLQGARPSLYPRTHQETNDVSAWRSSLKLDIPKDDVQRICRRYRLHPQCLGQAAWAKVVAMATGCEDVMFGQVVSGRVVAGAKDIIGPAFVGFVFFPYLAFLRDLIHGLSVEHHPISADYRSWASEQESTPSRPPLERRLPLMAACFVAFHSTCSRSTNSLRYVVPLPAGAHGRR